MITGNDRCIDARVITNLPAIHSGNTAGATPDFDSTLDDTCGVSLASRGVWYTLNSSKRRIVRLEYQLFSQGNNGNSELSIFTGSCEKLVCATNTEGFDHVYGSEAHLDNELATHEFLADEGETYYFLLSGELEGTVGEYTFQVTEYDIPENDVCENAIEPVSLPVTLKGSTFGATPHFNELSIDTCGVDWYTRGVWYKLEGHDTVIRLEYQLFSQGNNGNSELIIFTGSSCANLNCINTAPIEGFDHVYGSEAHLDNELATHEFLAVEGETYWFLLTGETFNTVADYEFKLSEYEIPPNDNCDGSIAVDTFPSKLKGTTLGATPDFNEHSVDTCGVNNWYTRGVWYNIAGRGAVVRLDYQLYSKGNNGNSNLSIFTGSSCNTLACKTNVEGFDHVYGSEANLDKSRRQAS